MNNHPFRSLLVALFALILELDASSSAFGATIVIQNNDPPGVGFNDPGAPMPGATGNPGTTLGDQRLYVFQQAANILGANLTSPVTITVRAQWIALYCDANSAILGAAGAITSQRDFAGAQFAGTWYCEALADKLSGTNQDPQPEIDANFNVNLGQPGCGMSFYLGVDNNHGSQIDLFAVVLHELAHGLGFLTFTNGSNGAELLGFPTIYDRFLMDLGNGKSWLQMTNAERVTSALNTQRLGWDGPVVTADVPNVLTVGLNANYVPLKLVLMYSPDPFQGGSSVSHWDTSAFPNQLMEPFAAVGVTHDVFPPNDLTRSELREIGWLTPLTALPNSIAVAAGNNQCTPVNTPFPTQFSVTISPPIAGLNVTFTANASAGGANGTFAGTRFATATTNSSGIATAPAFTANGTPGNYTMNATVPGAGTAAFAVCNTSGPPAATPTLGDYPNNPNPTVQLSENTTATPETPPTNTMRITVSTSTNFKGRLEGNPASGVVRVTDAHPAGTYTVTVTAFNGNGASTTTAVKTFILTVTTPVTCNPVDFMAPPNLAGANPRSVAIGDFNFDGIQDFAITLTDGNVSIRLGNGSGGFGAAALFSVGSVPQSVAVGDFNGDGRQDLAVSNSGSGTVSVLLNTTTTPAVTFMNATAPSVGFLPYSVAVGDFNGDGNQDFVTANNFSSNVSVRLGDGFGGFGNQQTFAVGGHPYSVAVGDFNRDGKQDLAVTNQDNSKLSILLGNGAGAFGAASDLVVESQPYSVAVGDFNGDGNQDLATANSGTTTVSVLLNMTAVGASAVTFHAAANFQAGSAPYSVVVGDFNGDGKQDLAAAAGNPHSGNPSYNASILLNTTVPGSLTAAFSAGTNFGAGGAPSGMAGGDFNGDGLQDLAVTNYGLGMSDVGDVSILLRQCPPGSYSNKSVQLSGNTTVTPSGAPTSTASINVSTSTSFKGKLEGDKTTGVVRVTDAHPAGDYMVKVTAFDGAGGNSTKTFLLTVTTPPACNPIGPISFKPKADFPAGANPRAVAIGDFDSDGIQDLAVALTDSHVSVLLGTGTGIGNFFGAAAPFAVNGTAQAVAVGDFNGDGRPDLATANPGSSTVSVLLNTTTGSGGPVTFMPATNPGVGSQPRSVAMGDFNGDGKQDLATANEASHSVSVLLGNGAGVFSRVVPDFDLGAGHFPYWVAVGDFNDPSGVGDGKQDLAVTTRTPDSKVVVLRGNGDGTFLAPLLFDVGNDPISVAVGDFNGGAGNGDGSQDLVTANQASGNASVLLNATLPFGVPNFSPITPFPLAGTAPQSVAVGDFNRNLKQDLAVANGGNNVSVLLGLGTGDFVSSPAGNFGAGSSPTSVAVGDFDADGRQDLAVANYVSNNVSILLGKCCSGTAPVGTAVSRKNHGACGTFDIPLSEVECRSGGPNGDYQIVVAFSSAVTYSGAVVKCGIATVVSSIGTNPVTINLTGVADAQNIKLTLVGADDGVNCGNVEMNLSVLIGDTNGNGCVSASDVAQTKSKAGQVVDGTNFRQDVNGNCSITAADIALVKSKAGTCKGPPCP